MTFPCVNCGIYLFICLYFLFIFTEKKSLSQHGLQKTNHQKIIALISPQSQRPVSDVAVRGQSISQTRKLLSDVVGQQFNCLLNHNSESDGWKREIGTQLYYYSLFPRCLQITGVSQKQFEPVLSTILTEALYSSFSYSFNSKCNLPFTEKQRHAEYGVMKLAQMINSRPLVLECTVLWSYFIMYTCNINMFKTPFIWHFYNKVFVGKITFDRYILCLYFMNSDNN